MTRNIEQRTTDNGQRTVFITVTQRGLEQARRLRMRLRSGEIYRPERYGPSPSAWEHVFSRPLSEIVPALFGQCDQLVFFLAAGAVTRLIAPCLDSKRNDPGVLAVDESANFVIPLLSGHLGGANAFARTVAGALGAVPVVTTASDVRGVWSPDLLAEEFGWVVEPADRLKSAALALVNGAPVAVIQEIGHAGCWLNERELPAGVVFAHAIERLPQQAFESILWISDRKAPLPLGERGWGEGEASSSPLTPSPSPPRGEGRSLQDRILWFRPRSLVLGVGCDRGIPLEALEEGVDQFLQAHGFAKASVHTLASIDVKADEEAIRLLAERHGWQTVFYSAQELAQAAIPNPSPVVERHVGVAGVAEPAALLASEAERLLVEKKVVMSASAPQHMTFALARFSRFRCGAERPGKVVFISAGPGDPNLLTLKARQALRQAETIVYAGSLVPEEVLRHASATADRHNSAFLTLEETVAIMVQAARTGKIVARLQSGDTSLYSAIQEQMTLLDEAGVAYEVIPGVSAFQAAAAALKSELTLPEEVQTVILTRGEGKTKMPAGETLESLARHGATLCIYLSARQSAKIQEQLLQAYPPETPVAIVYRVSWPEEKIIQTTLDHLSEEVRKHRLDRTTLILVGRAVGERGKRSQLYDPKHGHLFRARSAQTIE